MRVLCPIVEPFLLPMLHVRQKLPLGSSITGQFIGNDHTRNVLEVLEQLAQELLSGLLAAAALDQDAENRATLIHSPPYIVDLTLDRDKHLIQMPLVSRMGTSVTQFFGIPLTKFQAPLPNRFVGQHDASLGHDLFDVTVAEREAVVEPDTVADDFRREAIAFVEGSRSFYIHTASMPYFSAVCLRSFVKLTIPSSVFRYAY